MADYAPVIISGGNLDAKQVQTSVTDDLPTSADATLSDQAVDSTTSSTLALMTHGTDNAQVTLTLEDDELVFITSMVNFSGDTAGRRGSFQIYRDSTGIGMTVNAKNTAAATSGRDDFLSFQAFDSGQSGSVTYSTYWATEAGTFYSKQCYMIVTRCKIRS